MATWQIYLVGGAVLLLALRAAWRVISPLLPRKVLVPDAPVVPDANSVTAAYRLLATALDEATASAVRVQVANWFLPEPTKPGPVPDPAPVEPVKPTVAALVGQLAEAVKQ